MSIWRFTNPNLYLPPLLLLVSPLVCVILRLPESKNITNVAKGLILCPFVSAVF